MEVFTTNAGLRACVLTWRREGLRIGFVPTMGNLHAGHFSLIELARRHADRVVASVFVNPTQFGPHEDFANYPRTPDADHAGLSAHGCDVLFEPSVDEIYPYGASASVRVEMPGFGDVLEGASRPGHFAGVATVVSKLFNLVQPDLAVFGQKDYQQLLLIRRMTRDLRWPIQIIAGPTRREADGLARSSRNQYLTPAERARAGDIYRCLCSMREQLQAGQVPIQVETAAVRMLESSGFSVDYAVLRRREDLSVPDPAERHGLIALIAARLGHTRLIDNMNTD